MWLVCSVSIGPVEEGGRRCNNSEMNFSQKLIILFLSVCMGMCFPVDAGGICNLCSLTLQRMIK